MPVDLDLKSTINLPKTDFPMKANLPHLEPRILEKWERMGIYDRIREARRNRQPFVLHDGPPYANGHIHLGHALNKILKDFIVKSKTLAGFDSPYVPGWDCHGLPIEIKVAGQKRSGVDPVKIRRDCREYAEKFVSIQREEFKRLGVFGDWEKPYLTMSVDYEADTVRLVGKFIEKGFVYRGLKPVHWCISCETALAEAEVEYEDHSSPSVYVRFPLRSGGAAVSAMAGGRTVYGLIWTTTPWTLPANLAICFHPDFEYSLLGVGDSAYLVASELVESVARDCGFKEFIVLGRVRGTELKDFVFRHPWIDRESKGLLGSHVTLDQGTGAVHTAPGHGHEDYLIGIENGLEIYNPVDDSGRFVAEVEHFGGLKVFEANPEIVRFMSESGVLVGSGTIRHSYPHCWRCHNPVIFRATPQWFIKMDHADLRQRALDEIRKVSWIPEWGEERISNMIENRPDWCISRQRTWGVPIPVLFCADCRAPLLSAEVAEQVAGIFDTEGADAWYLRPAADFLPSGKRCPCGSESFQKPMDILDVWFDSGASHDIVLRDPLPWPADVYLEGGDQYRGWFHSSLLIAVGTRDAAPYRTVLCNGWTLDEEGRAMSKSLGNTISPLDVMKENGAEILRLWVASINYTEDVRLGPEILSRLREAYRKLRNTQRFLLGNLNGFDPSTVVEASEMEEIDRWALARMAQVAERVETAYSRFEFHQVYHALYRFCVVDLSSFYLDILKDRLYTAAPDSRSRRAAQHTLFVVADTLVRLLAPILPFTSEEVWENLHGANPPQPSVHLAEFRQLEATLDSADLLSRWQRLQSVREVVMKALEESRAGKLIGNSLEASVTLTAHPQTIEFLSSFEGLRYIFLVSELRFELDASLEGDAVRVVVGRATGAKCERCWAFYESVGSHADLPTVCDRCYGVLAEMGLVTAAESEPLS